MESPVQVRNNASTTDKSSNINSLYCVRYVHTTTDVSDSCQQGFTLTMSCSLSCKCPACWYNNNNQPWYNNHKVITVLNGAGVSKPQ